MALGDQIDSRGVSRGQCTLCDCLLFELGADGCCSYCLHPAPGHVNRDTPDDYNPVPVLEPLRDLAVSDSDHLENGRLEVQASEFYLPNRDRFWCCFFMLVVVALLLLLLTLGLIIFIFILIACAFCWCLRFCIPKPRVLMFDNAQKLMFSVLYEPIHYDQLSIAVIQLPHLRIAIYAKGVPPAEVTGRCVPLKKWFVYPSVAASPKFVIPLAMKDQNVPFFKEEFCRIVNLTKIAHTEPTISWEAIEAGVTNNLIERQASRASGSGVEYEFLDIKNFCVNPAGQINISPFCEIQLC